MKARAATSACRQPAHSLVFLAIVGCYLLQTGQAQQNAEQEPENKKPVEEIVVIVGRDGNRVDIDALLRDEIRLEVIRAYLLEQHVQEQESWRLRLRSSMQRKTSRIAWGYDAQAEAARFRFSQANYLPIDRVRPATFVSVRF